MGSTPGTRPNASGAATVSPDGKQVGKKAFAQSTNIKHKI